MTVHRPSATARRTGWVAAVARGWRAGAVAAGVLGLYVAGLTLKPDASLGRVTRGGVLRVCHPAALPPFIMANPDQPGRAVGLEARLVERLAAHLGLTIEWNLQPNWYRTWDPTGWGIRREACDLLVGGIAATDESRGLLELADPHLLSGWAWVRAATREPPRRAGFWAPFFGLGQGRTDALALLDERGIEPVFLESAELAVEQLRRGAVEAVVTDLVTARWVADQLGREAVAVEPMEELGSFQFAVGLWKGSTSLRRAVNRALSAARPADG